MLCAHGTRDALLTIMRDMMDSALRWCASACFVLGLAATPAVAETAADPPASTIRVIGQATVTSRPDRAEIDLGVVTRAATSQQAAAENARVLRNILASLRSSLGPTADIQTISYGLQPDYQYPQQGGAPKITGYTATNIVRITQDDLTNLGAVLDVATRSGANQIERIRFTLKDESAAQANALRLAALDARAKATSLANALGLQVVRIRSVDEMGAAPRPMYDVTFARTAEATTPILPGTIETAAMVTVTVDIGNRR
jgi:uncharacterized protein YggE